MDNAESNRRLSIYALSQAKRLPGQRWATVTLQRKSIFKYLICIFYLHEFQRKIRICRPEGDLYNRKRVTNWRPYNRFSVVPDNAESNSKMSRKALSQAKCLPGQRWAILWRCKDTAFEIFDLHFFFSRISKKNLYMQTRRRFI